jgi:beta-glucanase (GH16 family)
MRMMPRRRVRTLQAGLIALAALAASTAAPTTVTAMPSPAPTPDREFTFNEGFTQPKGTPAASSKWILQPGNGTNGWGNKQLQWYTGGARNAAHDGRGHMVITARQEQAGTCWNGRPCAYTSAKLMTATRFTQAYGHIEARIRFDIPPGHQRGFWPAFWALDAGMQESGYPRYGEIDIMENYGTGLVQSSLHGASRTAVPLTSWNTDHTFTAAERGAWHVYAVDWTSTRITFTIDGRKVGSRTQAQFGSSWTFDRPFFVILNVAVGGTGGGDPTTHTRFPLRMLVDYVRATT